MAKGLSDASSKLKLGRLGLLTKAQDQAAQLLLKNLRPVLEVIFRKHPQIEVSMENTSSQAFGSFGTKAKFRTRSAEEIAESSDLLISIGGDGTILRCARYLLKAEGWKKTLILGINAGHLGFLTFLGAKDLLKEMPKIFESPEDCTIERRMCLEILIQRKKRTIKSFHVLNDCVLSGGALSRIFEFSVEIDGEFLSSYRSDGLIVSTPTGSTAYNLAAGGSIIETRIDAIQLTPICAQSFSNKPILISDHHEVRLKLNGESTETYLTLDGQTGVKLEKEDEVRISKSNKSIGFLLPPGMKSSHYFHSLRQKLKWGMEAV